MYPADLIQTLRKYPSISDVHFTASGGYFFQVFEHTSGMYGQFIDGVPVIASRIVKSVYREDVINDSPVDEAPKENKKKK